MTDSVLEEAASPGAHTPAAPAVQRPARRPRVGGPQQKPAAAPRAPRAVHPVLEQLAGLYPHLFGAVFLPLKRGIFQDLLDAHPGIFERGALKVALGIHTRSTRYLQAVAAGQKRHDLQGQAVEDMAPEHVHHALIEVFRRRKPREGEDAAARLRARILQAFDASGLSREEYAERTRTRDEAANAATDDALAEAATRDARDEALLHAFEAVGGEVAAFADMYGMDPRAVAQVLARARHRRSPAA
ncbi:ProQ/FINO family protein [Ramlibacter sp. H39-3-26]|uniref:ProQ/FINO family protein n=1 Tax=Curvibacter soli TaxID=3031331 RepID=UPI0023DC58DD|nr:ProQ/FINO family protein [Ramlibacter sp. H39-3-26]MDF1486054.1 ProQ/FINO family protein [Ramlibacter sp. H39-3-26]